VVVMKSTIFLHITPYSPLRVSRHFRGTYCLHLQCRAVLATCCNTFFFLGHEDGSDIFLQNIALLSMDHTVIYLGRYCSQLQFANIADTVNLDDNADRNVNLHINLE
jgi:hypothetical protein